MRSVSDRHLPTDTQRNNNVIITSKRRRDVVLTQWCCYWFVCPLGSGYLGAKIIVTSHERCGVSNHRLLCSMVCSGKHHRKKLHFTGPLWVEIKPRVAEGFPAQKASNVEHVSISWRHGHVLLQIQPFSKLRDTQDGETGINSIEYIIIFSCLFSIPFIFFTFLIYFNLLRKPSCQ